MPATLKLDRPTLLHVALPESVRARLDLHLVSEVEGRVPKGAYQEFLCERIREFFEWKQLEIAPGRFIRGPKEAIDEAKRRLK